MNTNSVRIVSYNVNGIRSAMRKNLVEWLRQNPADIICLQEIKAHKENVDFHAIENEGFHTYWFPAEKKGYSGVAVFSKIEPISVHYGNTYEQSNREGRTLRLDFDNFTLINAYFPSGTSGDIRQTYKYQWLNEFFDYLNDVRKEKNNLVVCGDYNICHKEIDIHDPKGNKNSSGFLPDERAWMDKFFENDFVDSFRLLNQDPHHYSWWSLRAASRERNKGWRIDYINVSKSLEPYVSEAAIWPDIKHSDHCPVYLKLDFAK